MTISNLILKPKVFLVCNVISILIGVTVLFGWYTHQPSLIQIHEAWAPMQYNTALGFLFCGLAGISILYSKFKVGRCIALIPILLGALTLIEYVFGIDLHIDEMFIKHYIITKTSHLGRMAPSTAVCFVFAGVSIELAGFFSTKSSKKIYFTCLAGGFLLISLSLLAIIGYVVGLELFYGWGHLTRMAIHTSLGFLILGVGIASNSVAYYKSEKSIVFFSFVILVSLMLVVSVLAFMERKAQDDVKLILQTSLIRTVSELNHWIDEVERDSVTWSKLPGIKAYVDQLLKVSRDPKSLLASPYDKKLDDLLRPIIKRYGYVGYIVVAPDHVNIASMLKLNVGDKNVLTGKDDYLRRAFEGEVVLTSPFRSEIPLENSLGEKVPDSPTMFSLAPLYGENQRVEAVIIFRLNPFKGFTQIFQLGIIGETGETYAFNGEGQMVSESRFNQQLIKMGLIPPNSSNILSVEVRDPGGNLIEGFSPSVPKENQPFTLMATSALRGERKSDIAGYRDYRGVPVVGSWVWLERIGLGVAVEIDIIEMYAVYNYFRNSVLFLLISMIALFTVFALQLNKRRRLLVESDERLNLALGASNAGVWDWNVVTGEIVFSPQWYESLGYKDNEFAGTITNWEKLIHPEDLPIVTETLKNCFEGKTSSYEVENRLLMKSGEYRWNIDRGKIIERDEKRNPLRMVGVYTDITSLKKVQSELEKAQKKNETILNSAGDGIYGLDLNGCTTFVNPAAEKMLGFSSDEMLGQSQHSLTHHSRSDGTPYAREECFIYSAFKDGKAHSVSDEVFWRKDGTCFPVEYLSTPVWESGELRGAVVTFKDISDRIKAEDIATRFGRILDKSSNEIYIFDASTLRFSQVNSGARENLGYSMEELSQMTLLDLKPVYTSDTFGELVEPLCRGEKSVIIFETIHKRKNETLYPVEIILQLMREETPPVFIAIVQDITLRKETEKELELYRDNLEELVDERTQEIQLAKNALEISQKTYSNLLSNLNGMVYRCKNDKNWTMEFVSKGALELTGYPPEDIEQNSKVSYNEIIHPDDRGQVWNKVQSALAQDKPYILNYRITTANGTVKWVFEQGRGVFSSEGELEALEGFITDVTKQIEAEQNFKASQSKLLHMEKLTALGKLTGSIAHEFNNPLQGIKNVMEIIEDSNLSNEEIKLVKLGSKECDRMAGMIRGLRSFYKPSTGRVSRVDLNSSVKEVLALQIKSLRIKGIEVKPVLFEGLPKIEVVEDQIKQVLLNLIQNASDSISKGDGQVTLSTKYQGSNVMVMVQDTGVGISKDEIKSIFEPFYTTKGVKGTGLGLSISYGIIKDHGGNIQVESEVGKGSTFTISLPIQRPQTAMESEEA